VNGDPSNPANVIPEIDIDNPQSFLEGLKIIARLQPEYHSIDISYYEPAETVDYFFNNLGTSQMFVNFFSYGKSIYIDGKNYIFVFHQMDNLPHQVHFESVTIYISPSMAVKESDLRRVSEITKSLRLVGLRMIHFEMGPFNSYREKAVTILSGSTDFYYEDCIQMHPKDSFSVKSYDLPDNRTPCTLGVLSNPASSEKSSVKVCEFDFYKSDSIPLMEFLNSDIVESIEKCGQIF
jgi:hypothetical protein